MKVCFVLGSADISGGTFVLFQHALHLQELGHEVHIATMFPIDDIVQGWHPALAHLQFGSIDDVRGKFDLAIATWWKTVYELHKVRAAQYCYFVQSIESRFYPEDEAPLRRLVDATYALPLPMLTEATWIEQVLHTRGAPSVQLVRNGVLKDVYRPDGWAEAPREDGTLRVLVEGSLGVPFKNVPRTLRLCASADVGPVWLLTITDIDSYPGVEKVVSRVPVARTAEVYRACDVLVKLSYVEGMFGPPLEMFHCGGTAITYDVTGHDEYIVDGYNALVVPVDDEQGVILALRRLAAEPELLRRLKAAARVTAQAWPSWEESSAEFATALDRVLKEPAVKVESFRPQTALAWDIYVRDEQARLRGAPLTRIRARVKPRIRQHYPRLFRILATMHYQYRAGRSKPG
jgi:glycosyltransferase involved in cell wall biosynthesis